MSTSAVTTSTKENQMQHRPFGTSTFAQLLEIERHQAAIEKADPSPHSGPTPLARRHRSVAPWVAPVEEADAEPRMTNGLCPNCTERGITRCTTCGVPDNLTTTVEPTPVAS